MNVNTITVEADIKLNTISGTQRIADRFFYPGSRAWTFYVVGGSLSVAISPDCNNAPLEVSASTPLTVGDWHNVAFTYDGTRVRIYQDGIEVLNQPYTGGICTTGSSPLLIGTYTTRTESFLNGVVDEVRISNIVRY